MLGLGRLEGFGPFLSLLLTVGLSLLILWGLCWLFHRGYDPPDQTPLEILQARLARGEITQAEYELACRSLQQR